MKETLLTKKSGLHAFLDRYKDFFKVQSLKTNDIAAE